MELLESIVEHFGSQSDLARSLNVSPQAVSEWLSGNRPVPPLRALQIERLSNNKFLAANINPKVAELLGEQAA